MQAWIKKKKSMTEISLWLFKSNIQIIHNFITQNILWSGSNVSFPLLWVKVPVTPRPLPKTELHDFWCTTKNAMTNAMSFPWPVWTQLEGFGAVAAFLIYLLTLKFQQQPVGHKLNVLLHQVAVHANQVAGESLCQEFLLNRHSIFDYGEDFLLWRLADQVFEHQASKVAMQTL